MLDAVPKRVLDFLKKQLKIHPMIQSKGDTIRYSCSRLKPVLLSLGFGVAAAVCGYLIQTGQNGVEMWFCFICFAIGGLSIIPILICRPVLEIEKGGVRFAGGPFDTGGLFKKQVFVPWSHIQRIGILKQYGTDLIFFKLKPEHVEAYGKLAALSEKLADCHMGFQADSDAPQVIELLKSKFEESLSAS